MPPNLAHLTRELDRLSTSAHTPADGLSSARAIVKAIGDARLYRTLPIFEAKVLERHGYPDDAQVWWKKVKQLDEDIRADLLRLATCVNQLRRERFRTYWAVVKVQRAVLDFLYVASDGGVPRISRSYLREATFIV